VIIAPDPGRRPDDSSRRAACRGHERLAAGKAEVRGRQSWVRARVGPPAAHVGSLRQGFLGRSLTSAQRPTREGGVT